MGQSQSIREKVEEEKKKNPPNVSKAFELLEIEQKMRDKLECKKARLYIDALNDECIPIVCAVDKFEDFRVVGSVAPGELKTLLKPEIEKCLEKHLSGDHHAKLSDLLTQVFESVLTTQKTQLEEQQTHVVLANRNIIRIDYFLFFMKSEHINVLCYYVQVGVIDMTRARKQVLIYELTRATEKEKLKDAGEELNEIAKSIITLTDAVDTLAKAARGEKVNVNEDQNEENQNEEMDEP